MRDLTPEQNKECLGLALTELQRLESGIEGVLTASRVERAGLRLDAHLEDIGCLLTEYVESKTDEVKLKGGVLEAGPMPQMWANVDRSLFRQMLDNLVNNAILHCQNGVTIRISLAEQGGCAVISVLDDGPGLDRQEWKKVFRMFYRAPKASNPGSGTGLGLFIVAGIATAHGGRTWVDSDGEGCGCNFRVAFPLNTKGKAAA
jgi:signal transduction histidine kinase